MWIGSLSTIKRVVLHALNRNHSHAFVLRWEWIYSTFSKQHWQNNTKPDTRQVFSAGGGTWTRTTLRSTDFESASSANSDTPACCISGFLPEHMVYYHIPFVIASSFLCFHLVRSDFFPYNRYDTFVSNFTRKESPDHELQNTEKAGCHPGYGRHRPLFFECRASHYLRVPRSGMPDADCLIFKSHRLSNLL